MQYQDTSKYIPSNANCACSISVPPPQEHSDNLFESKLVQVSNQVNVSEHRLTLPTVGLAQHISPFSVRGCRLCWSLYALLNRCTLSDPDKLFTILRGSSKYSLVLPKCLYFVSHNRLTRLFEQLLRIMDICQFPSTFPFQAHIFKRGILYSQYLQLFHVLKALTCWASSPRSTPPSPSSSSSIGTSPNSFSITASRRPCLADRIWLTNVVFPAPRKPVMTVTGNRARRRSSLHCSASRFCCRFTSNLLLVFRLELWWSSLTLFSIHAVPSRSTEGSRDAFALSQKIHMEMSDNCWHSTEEKDPRRTIV